LVLTGEEKKEPKGAFFGVVFCNTARFALLKFKMRRRSRWAEAGVLYSGFIALVCKLLLNVPKGIILDRPSVI